LLTFFITAKPFRGHDGIIGAKCAEELKAASRRCRSDSIRRRRRIGRSCAGVGASPRIPYDKKINYAHYVEEAVSSVDDGSADNTASRLRRFGNATRYLYKPNGGQASAFNYGFQHARGEVVAVLDADDVWLPEKLARISRGIRTPPQCRDGLPPHVLVGRRK